MDDIRKKRLQASADKLMEAHDELVDLLPAKKKKPQRRRRCSAMRWIRWRRPFPA